MKKFLTTAAIALSMMTAAHAAEPVTLYSNGTWVTSYIPPEGNHGGMCVTGSAWSFPGKNIGTMFVKWSGDLGLFIHIAKSNWQMPTNANVTIKISFDSGWREGKGFVLDNHKGGSTVQIMANEDSDGFMADFRNAREVTISFPDGNEKPWSGTMVGSRKAGEVFARCISSVKGDTPVATSPLAPSQPKATSPINPTSPVKPTAKKDDGSV